MCVRGLHGFLHATQAPPRRQRVTRNSIARSHQRLIEAHQSHKDCNGRRPLRQCAVPHTWSDPLLRPHGTKSHASNPKPKRRRCGRLHPFKSPQRYRSNSNAHLNPKLAEPDHKHTATTLSQLGPQLLCQSCSLQLQQESTKSRNSQQPLCASRFEACLVRPQHALMRRGS